MAFQINQVMATKSPCYQKATPITVTGIVVHSTGANNPNLKRYVQPDDGNLGVNVNSNSVNRVDHRVIAHAYIGKDKNGNVKCYQTLPFNIACWSAGSGSKGSYNYNPQARIQFEICEDGLTNADYFNKVFDCAAEFCAYLCTKFNLSVDKICSHKEGHKNGYASNHGDPENWLSKFGKDMNWFRDKVKVLLDAQAKQTTTSTATTTKPTTQTNAASGTLYCVQVGAFSNKENAEAHVAKLKKAGFDAFIVESVK